MRVCVGLGPTSVPDILFPAAEYGIKTFPSDHTKLGEMEFYLLEDLDFHLTVFHPYRDLVDLCGGHDIVEVGEEGEVGFVPENERFWGTGKGRLELEDGAVQTAWYVSLCNYAMDADQLFFQVHSER